LIFIGWVAAQRGTALDELLIEFTPQ